MREHLISVYNGKRGLHLVVLYLVVGRWRVPWSFRVWRGKGTPSPAQLAFKLVKGVPKSLTKHFQVMILADTDERKCKVSTWHTQVKIPRNYRCAL